jgi:hypothetical protein
MSEGERKSDYEEEAGLDRIKSEWKENLNGKLSEWNSSQVACLYLIQFLALV